MYDNDIRSLLQIQTSKVRAVTPDVVRFFSVIPNEMQIVLLIILFGSSTMLVNGKGAVQINPKIMNATCDGKSCDNYSFKICYARHFQHEACLDLIGIFTISNFAPVYSQRFDNATQPYSALPVKDLPSSYRIYFNNLALKDNSTLRDLNGTTMLLTFRSNMSFIKINLTSKCIEPYNCTGFLCDRCYYSSPSVTVPHSKNGEIGKNITIPCSISNLTVDTRIKWLKNNVSLNAVNRFNESDRLSGGTFKSPDLTILSAQKEDEGNYICQAQNLDFIGSSQPVHLSLFEDPVVNITNIEPVKEGTNVSISCNVYPAYGVTNITWYKNNSILDIHRHERLGGGTISSPSLMIYFVDENDEGNYTCQATNPVGTDISKPQNVQVLPDIPIVLTSKEETVTIGEYVTLSCNISSVSKLTKVVWYKNNIEFNFNANGTKDNDKFIGGTLQDPSLTIYSVQITDEGNYICNASNAADKTGWSKPVHLSVFEATTESLPSTDIIFSTSELSTPSSDIISTDQIFSTSELSTPSSDIISTDLVLSTSDLTTLIFNTTSSTFETTKTSTVPSSVKTTITTPSAKVPSTKSPNSSPTVNMSTTTSSTLSYSKSTTSPSSSKSPRTVMSTIRPTTIHTSVSFSSNLPTHATRSKPSTKIPYRSSTVKTSTTTSSTVKASTTTSSTVKTSTTTSPTVKTSTLTSSTSKYPVSPSSAVGSTGNSENLNAWVITTTVICVVEFIVIVLVVYILWLRKQRRLALQYEKEETVF